METRRIRTVLFGVSGAVFAGGASALPVTVSVNGEITDVDAALLSGDILAGDAFNWTFTYETSAMDSDAGDATSSFENAIINYNFSSGSFTVSGEANSSQIQLFDNFSSFPDTGNISVAHNSSGAENAGVGFVGLRTDFSDPTQTLLSSPNLVDLASSLETLNASDNADLMVMFADTTGFYQINGFVESVSIVPPTSPDPAPTTVDAPGPMSLLAMGALAFVATKMFARQKRTFSPA